MHAISMAAPWNGKPQWYLQLLAMVTLAGLLNQCTNKLQAGCLGFIFASTWLASVFWWLFISMHTYAGLPALLALLAVLALAFFLSLYYALICSMLVTVKGLSRFHYAIIFGALWMLAEMGRGHFFTGFPWGASAYAHTDSPLAAMLPWVGAYGLSGLLGWLSMSLAQLTFPKSRTWVAPIVLCFVAWSYQQVVGGFTETTGQLKVALLQGNIPQDEKFEPGSGVPIALQWYSEQLVNNQTELVVAPETAIPLLPQQLPAGYMDSLIQRYSAMGQAAMIGFPWGSLSQGYTNSIIGLKPGQSAMWRYDKHHLVPFGEFIPPFFKWFTAMMDIPLGDFKSGDVEQPSFEWHGQRLAGNICYEDLFGEEIGARFINREHAPTIFVNASNIAWFGNTLAIDQHLAISRIRALEFERPFVRATNTGATAIIDHRGEVISELPRLTQGVLNGAVEGRIGLTPYAKWVSHFGLWPLVLIAISLLVNAWYRNDSRKMQAKAP